MISPANRCKQTFKRLETSFNIKFQTSKICFEQTKNNVLEWLVMYGKKPKIFSFKPRMVDFTRLIGTFCRRDGTVALRVRISGWEFEFGRNKPKSLKRVVLVPLPNT